MLPAPLQRGLLHTLFYHDHRHRLQDPDDRAGRQARQAADMGHRRAGALPDNHNSVLQRRDGNIASI